MTVDSGMARVFVAVVFAAGCTTAHAADAPAVAAGQAATSVFFPEDVGTAAPIEARRKAQLARRAEIQVFQDFGFTDRQPASGLDFLHRIVDDAGKHYKAVHYDHGNGVAAADIDNDGRIDLYFVSQAGPHGLFRNLGGGRFEDITASAGVAGDGAIGVTASFADIDNDGDADLHVTHVRAPNRLFRNDGKGSFTDITEASGLGYAEHSSAAVFFDYDRDGRLDLFLCVVGEYTLGARIKVTGTPKDERPPGPPVSYHLGHKDGFGGHLVPSRLRASRLFHNEGNAKFRDVTEETGLVDTGWTGDATPVDFDGDGWQDLYVLNMQGSDQLWRNRDGKRFERDPDGVFPKTPWGSMGVKHFDYDNDGKLDLFVTDMHSDMSEKIGEDKEKLKATWITSNWSPEFLRTAETSIFGNALFHHEDDGRTRDTSDAMNAEMYWPWGLSVGDLNADGWLDALLTAGMNYPFRYVPNTLLLNDGGRVFRDAEYVLGIEPRRGGRLTKAWFDLDCAAVDRANAHCKGLDGPVTVHGALASRSSVIVDVDDDGDLDIVTAEFGDVPQLLLSNLAEKRGAALRFVKVRLVGSASNRDGLGARVTVTAGAQRWVQVHDGKSGYLAQSSLPLYFGLGAAERVDAIEVAWPGGRRSRLEGAALNGLVEITEAAQ